MKIPESEEEKEALARTLIRQGYGGKPVQMLHEVFNWMALVGSQGRVFHIADLAKILLSIGIENHLAMHCVFIKKNPMGLTELGEALLGHYLQNKALVSELQKGLYERFPVSGLDDSKVLNLFSEAKKYHRENDDVYTYDHYWLGAEILLNRPHLREEAGL